MDEKIRAFWILGENLRQGRAAYVLCFRLEKKAAPRSRLSACEKSQTSLGILGKPRFDDASHSVKMLCDIAQSIVPGFLPYGVFNMHGAIGRDFGSHIDGAGVGNDFCVNEFVVCQRKVLSFILTPVESP